MVFGRREHAVLPFFSCHLFPPPKQHAHTRTTHACLRTQLSTDYVASATLELDSDGDFVKSHYDYYDKQTWLAGRTRLNVTVLGNGGGQPGFDFSSDSVDKMFRNIWD